MGHGRKLLEHWEGALTALHAPRLIYHLCCSLRHSNASACSRSSRRSSMPVTSSQACRRRQFRTSIRAACTMPCTPPSLQQAYYPRTSRSSLSSCDRNLSMYGAAYINSDDSSFPTTYSHPCIPCEAPKPTRVSGPASSTLVWAWRRQA